MFVLFFQTTGKIIRKSIVYSEYNVLLTCIRLTVTGERYNTKNCLHIYFFREEQKIHYGKKTNPFRTGTGLRRSS